MSIYLKYSFGVPKTRGLTAVLITLNSELWTHNSELKTHNSKLITLLHFSALRLRSVWHSIITLNSKLWTHNTCHSNRSRYIFQLRWKTLELTVVLNTSYLILNTYYLILDIVTSTVLDTFLASQKHSNWQQYSKLWTHNS